MNIFLIIILILLLVVVIYFWIIRPRTLTWGATQEEAGQPLPGDDIVQKPHFIATRAVTIKAPPSEVWKWIIQIGSARAGWYSIDWMDNDRVPSSRKILPEFQKIEDGYFIPFTPNQKNGMWVKEYKEHEYILWWDKKGNGTWGWYLKQQGDGHSRLITRLRTIYDLSFPWVIYYLLYDFGDIIMMRKCMLGIKERAENNVL
jgi:hypothetical protein